jgi:hypothetical protein
MNARDDSRIRCGAIGLLGAGVIALVGEFLRGPRLDPSANAASFAQAVTGGNFTLA